MNFINRKKLILQIDSCREEGVEFHIEKQTSMREEFTQVPLLGGAILDSCGDDGLFLILGKWHFKSMNSPEIRINRSGRFIFFVRGSYEEKDRERLFVSNEKFTSLVSSVLKYNQLTYLNYIDVGEICLNLGLLPESRRREVMKVGGTR